MKLVDWTYALLALLGLVGPWSFNLAWMGAAADPSGLQFIADATANPAASSIALDITIACVAFFVWMLVESRRLGMRHTWLLIPYALMGSFASAFPLFLLLRSRRLSAAPPQAP